TGMTDFFSPLTGPFGGNFQVLWGDVVGNVAGFVQTGDEDEGAAVHEAGADDVRAGHGGQETVDGLGDLVQVGRVGAQQNRLGKLVVLGLREQIHGDPVGGCGPISDDEDL